MSKDCGAFIFRAKQKIFDPENEGTTSLQNVGHYLPINMVKHPRILESS
jgi:hypothetical protein